MPKILLQLLVFILPFSLIDTISAQNNALIPFYDIAKCAYGFKTKENALVIDARFQKVKQFNSSGICQVMLNDKWGLINEKGDFIIDPVLDNIWDFHPKYNVCPAKSNDKWGFVNLKGQWTISPIGREQPHLWFAAAQALEQLQSVRTHPNHPGFGAFAK